VSMIISEIPSDFLQSGQTKINDPLTDLESNEFAYQIYQYPTSMNPDYPDKGHYIVFYINVPALSSWATNISDTVQPVANRGDVTATRFGLRTEALKSGGGDGGFGDSFGQLFGFSNLVLGNKTKRTTAAISLYIPNTMVFLQNAQWETISLSSALGLVGKMASSVDLISKGKYGAAAASVASAVSKGIVGPISTMLVGTDLTKALGDINGIALAAAGMADNPQNFLLFKQMDFRKFQFDFILTPETPQEAEIIKQIIYLFRFHSAPEVMSDSGGRFFIPPSMFDIDFIHDGKRNAFLPKLSTCVINSINVDYAAAGQWSTYNDGVPLQTRLTIDFTESEIMTKDRIMEGF